MFGSKNLGGQKKFVLKNLGGQHILGSTNFGGQNFWGVNNLGGQNYLILVSFDMTTQKNLPNPQKIKNVKKQVFDPNSKNLSEINLHWL